MKSTKIERDQFMKQLCALRKRQAAVSAAVMELVAAGAERFGRRDLERLVAQSVRRVDTGLVVKQGKLIIDAGVL